MLMAMRPKYAVLQVVEYIEGKSAIQLPRCYRERKRNFVGQRFSASRYFVSTLGRYKGQIREYIRSHEQERRRLDQLSLLRSVATL
jgi:putative transposase